MEIDKIVLVTRQTRLEENIKRYNTKSQAKFFIQSRGQSFDDYELEDSNYQKAKDKLIHFFPQDIKLQTIDRTYLSNFVFGPKDLVVVLGQDGLVVNTAKYLNGQFIIAVNPDPERFDGILLPFKLNNVNLIFLNLLNSKFQFKEITMGKVELNDGQTLFAFNDFYVGAKTHISARYTIHYQKKTERQSSSGILISTPAGSTGWFSSVMNMTKGINQFNQLKQNIDYKNLDWKEKKLLFVVREPFQSKWSGSSLVTGEITSLNEIKIESHMPESGVIFSDGMENDFLEFNSGSTAKIKIADKTTKLILNL